MEYICVIDGWFVQRLPCTFLDDLPEMGYLEGTDRNVSEAAAIN